MLTRAFLACFLLLAGKAVAQDVPLPSALTDAQINAAIDDGFSGRITEGYRVARSNAWADFLLGHAYTPYVRVALAAKAAKDLSKSFSRADVTPEMTAPLVYFVALPLTYRIPPISVTSVLVVPKGSDDPTRAIQPVWTKEDVDATWQNLFGALFRTAWLSPGMVAAFPMTALEPDHEFLVLYKTNGLMLGAGPNKSGRRAAIKLEMGQTLR